LDIVESLRSRTEFVQAIESLAHKTGQVMAPFDRELAGLLDEVSWQLPDGPPQATDGVCGRHSTSMASFDIRAWTSDVRQ
jgi:hypothetical protein